MGKSLIIKGADFSANRVGKEVIVPSVNLEQLTIFTQRSPGLFRGWGPYIEKTSKVIGAKLCLPSTTDEPLLSCELYIVEIGETYSGSKIPGTLLTTVTLQEERCEKIVLFDNPVMIGGTTQIVMRTPLLFCANNTDPDYIIDGWGKYINCSSGGVVELSDNPQPTGYYRFGISLIIEES